MKFLATFSSLSLAASLFVPAFAPAPAAAAGRETSCPTQTSIFGYVTEVTPQFFTVQTQGGDEGKVHVFNRGTRTHSNGLALRPGVYTGVYGCYRPDDSFRAYEITLARNANDYNGYRRQVTTISGRITEVRADRVLLDSNSDHGHVWVYTNPTNLRLGERVTFRGTFDPENSAFIATQTLQQ